MRPLKFSFLFYATVVAFGILCKSFCTLRSIVFVFCLFFLFLLAVTASKRIWTYRPIMFYFVGFSFYVLCFSSGFLASYFADWKNKQNNYAFEVLDQCLYQVHFSVLEKQKNTGNKSRYLVEIEAIDLAYRKGKSIVWMNDSLVTIGSKCSAIGYFKSFELPVNLGQFDYASYMHSKEIGKQLYLEQLYKVENAHGVYAFIMKIRTALQQRIYSHPILTTNTKAILDALLLGDRVQLDDTVVLAFQRLGLMHVLAISGLHIGVIYAFLTQITFF